MAKALVVVHFYYLEQVETILEHLKNVTIKYDLYCTIGNEQLRQEICDQVLNFRKDAHIVDVENVGYDVWPFIKMINSVDLSKYDYIIKLHTKRDIDGKLPINIGNGFYIKTGGYWRDCLYSFLDTKDNFEKCLKALERPNVGMCARFNVIHNAPNHCGVIDYAKSQYPKYFLDLHDHSFVAGTMFIAKAAPFQMLKNMNIGAHLFEKPTKEHKTQFAHVIERTIGAIIYKSGMKIVDPFTSRKHVKKVKQLYEKRKWCKRLINYITFPIPFPKVRRRIKDKLFAKWYAPYLNNIVEFDMKYGFMDMDKEHTPKISVIIPVYNTGKYLARCLDSVVQQTFNNLEIICVNDGSTDDSAKILKQYAQLDKRIKIITQKNSGLSAARNAGLKHMSGEYVSFIDSDDWIDANYYEYLLHLIEQKHADIAMAGMRIVTDKHISDNTTPNMVTDKFVEKIRNLPNGSMCDKLFKSELFHDLEFPRGRYYEDNIVLVKVMHKSKTVAFSNLVSYYYFMNYSGICRTKDPEIIKRRSEDRLYFAQEILNFGKSNHCQDLDKIRDFLLRTVIADFASKKSPYYDRAKHILGENYMHKICIKDKNKVKKILLRLLCLFVPSRNMRHKIKDYFN